MKENYILKNEEKAIFALRSLYKSFGYLPYKMSKFEEYDLYVRNKDFLVSDSVITFNDTNGRLLALKPDVTLSIIKNSNYEASCKQKLYYNENVYRISDSTHQFKEIMQTGIECIGDIDINDVFEVIYLAAKSLDSISSEFVLDISHMGILTAILDTVSDDPIFKKDITKLISEKNRHETSQLCKAYGINSQYENMLIDFIGLYGNIEEVLPKLEEILDTIGAKKDAYEELKALCALIQGTDFKQKIRADFSVVNDMNYYNGIVFKGFLNGISEGVLAGGEYGKLVKRMGKDFNAIGFALYIDLLEALETSDNNYDVDVLLIYDKNTAAENLFATKYDLINKGMTVSAQLEIPKKLRYKEIVDLRRKS